MNRERKRAEKIETEFQKALAELKTQDEAIQALHDEFEIDTAKLADARAAIAEHLDDDTPAAPTNQARAVINHQFVLRG